MRLLVQRIYNSPSYAKTLVWGKLLIVTGSAQVLVQAIGLISGILVIRLLPTQEYALYTLSNTMLGTMVLLADGGISAGVMAQGGKVWQDKEKLGIILATGLDLRKKFAIGSLLIAIPILFYLLLHHGATWLVSVLLVVSLIPSFITALSGTLLEIAPKLHQDIPSLQKNQVIANVGRLALLTLSLFSFPWASVAILSSGLPQIWANNKLRKMSSSYADWSQQSDPLYRKEILLFVKRILPGSIYYCLAGQITIWLISIFGSTVAVAQVGALGRLSMMLGIFSVLFSTLIAPRFARLPSNVRLLLNRYIQIEVGLIAISCFIIAFVWLFPTQVLWLLGNKYSNLSSEVVLSIVNSCLGLITGASFAICTSRGWVLHPAISIPITIGAISLGIVLFNISTLKGILTLNIFVAIVEAVMYFTYNIANILKSE